MSAKENCDVAVIFDDLTEFFAIRGDIDALIKKGVSVDIHVAPNNSEAMRLDTQSKIEGLGYPVINKPVYGREYKVLLEPYPLQYSEGVRFEFRIKYSYSASSAKPDPVFLPGWNLPYDATISYSKRDAEIRSVYGRAHLVNYTKYKKFQKKRHKGKPNLLYLPTFGEISSISRFNDKVVLDIKKKYNLIVKAHHAVQFSAGEQGGYSLIKKMADEFYDSDTPLESLLARADMVLSDNSGAIFEAIYSETPVAVFSDKLNKRKLGGINTLQYKLVMEGIVPCATKPGEVMKVLDRAMELSSKQKGVKLQNFTVVGGGSSNEFVSIIREYLNKDREDDVYLMSHDVLLKDFNEKNHRIQALEIQLQQLHVKIVEYENSKSWKITRPLRKINKITGRKRHD